MTEKEYYDHKLNEISKDFLDKCIEHINQSFLPDLKRDIKKLYKEEGEIEWAIPFHHHWGMAVRNGFREAGFKDDNLPDGNWDDYYIQVIELALGLRTL